jgi:hypothetical protein
MMYFDTASGLGFAGYGMIICPAELHSRRAPSARRRQLKQDDRHPQGLQFTAVRAGSSEYAHAV